MPLPVQGAVGNLLGEASHPGLLTQQIIEAYKAGFSNVTVNPGTYVMPDGNRSVFNFDRWTNFTINASKALFIVGPEDTFVLNNCSNVTIQGATVRPKTYPFTQGRVTRIVPDNPGNVYADWKIDAGYPTNFLWWFNAVAGDTRRIRLEAGDIYFNPNNAEYLGDQAWRLHFPGNNLDFQTNDWLVARNLTQGHAFYLRDCRNCTLLEVTSQSGGYATYYEAGGGGNHMIRCRIQPAPTAPPGGVEPPVVGCAADGVHTVGTYPGLHMEGCVFEGVFLDDNVAIHGSFQIVASVVSHK